MTSTLPASVDCIGDPAIPTLRAVLDPVELRAGDNHWLADPDRDLARSMAGLKRLANLGSIRALAMRRRYF